MIYTLLYPYTDVYVFWLYLYVWCMWIKNWTELNILFALYKEPLTTKLTVERPLQIYISKFSHDQVRIN